MKKAIIQRLGYLCETIPDLLHKIPETEFAQKPSSDKWSKKEILGHLIDSAANNHQRFIRVQFEEKPTIVYDQENWNRFSKHNEANTDHLIELWTGYNRFLVNIIKEIPDEHLKRECHIGNDFTPTLGWLINDYVRHMEHHFRQIVDV